MASWAPQKYRSCCQASVTVTSAAYKTSEAGVQYYYTRKHVPVLNSSNFVTTVKILSHVSTLTVHLRS